MGEFQVVNSKYKETPPSNPEWGVSASEIHCCPQNFLLTSCVLDPAIRYLAVPKHCRRYLNTGLWFHSSVLDILVISHCNTQHMPALWHINLFWSGATRPILPTQHKWLLPSQCYGLFDQVGLAFLKPKKTKYKEGINVVKEQTVAWLISLGSGAHGEKTNVYISLLEEKHTSLQVQLPFYCIWVILL